MIKKITKAVLVANVLICFIDWNQSAFAKPLDKRKESSIEICKKAKGVLVFQIDGETKKIPKACFRPLKGRINNYYTKAPAHGNKGKWEERFDYDILSSSKVHFYEMFRETRPITVCNFSDKVMEIHWNSMDFLSPFSEEEKTIEQMKCKKGSTHMVNIETKRTKPKSANTINATLDGNSHGVEMVDMSTFPDFEEGSSK